MYLTLMGTMVIAAMVGFGFERAGLTRNGYVPSIIICLGGAVLFYFIRVMFGIGFGSAGLDAILSAVGALVVVPTRYRK